MSFVTAEQLAAGLPHILAAPKASGPIASLCYRRDFRDRSHPNRLEVCPDRGVLGDRWAEKSWLRLPDGRPDPQNQICILPTRVYGLVCQAARGMPHPGDTLIADLDMTEANLPAGSLLQIGTAVLRISELFNDACVKWRRRYGDVSYRWLNLPEHRPLRLRGVFCSVHRAGVITRADRLMPLPAPMARMPADAA